MKKGNTNSIKYLDLTYLAMLIVCALLSVGNNGIEGLIINACLFIIVGIIFSNAKKKFILLRKISRDFNEINKKIKTDYENEHKMLWQLYKDNQLTDLFNNDDVKNAYTQYLSEKKRLELLSEGNYTSKIDDYVNRDLIDSIMRKNVYNLVPGVMTGLGILGTFIGLTLGLQHFNTGSASEISNSIAPLMDGIKVAFHTSIYGMIFSLVFNYVYKAILEASYNEIDEFLDCFNGYVVGDSNYENEKNTAIMLNKMPELLANKLNDILAPNLTEMNVTLRNLAENVNKNQVTGLSNIVDHFIEEMNKSLSGKFEELGKTIEKTCEMQRQNYEFVENIYKSISNVASDVEKVNKLSNETVEKMSAYVSEIEGLQKIINENYMSINVQLDSQLKANEDMGNYINELSSFVKQISETNDRIAQASEKHIESIKEISDSITSDLTKATSDLTKVSSDLSSKMGDSINTTFESFDENLADITRHLSGTISEIDETTGKVPSVVAAAYEEMEAAFNSIQEKMIELIKDMQNEINKNK